MSYDFTSVVINGIPLYGRAYWDDDILDVGERQYEASLTLIYGAYETDSIDLEVRNALLHDRSTHLGVMNNVSHFQLPFSVVVIQNEDGDDKIIREPKRVYLVNVNGILVKHGVFSTKEKAAAEVERLSKKTDRYVSMVAIKLDTEIE